VRYYKSRWNPGDKMNRVIVKCVQRCDRVTGHLGAEIDVGEIREFIEKEDEIRYYFATNAWYPKERFVPTTQLEKLLWLGRRTNEVKVNT